MKLGPILNSLYGKALRIYGIVILVLLAALAVTGVVVLLGADGNFRIYGGSPYEHMSSRPWPITTMWILMDIIYKFVAIPIGAAAVILVLTAAVMLVFDKWKQRS